MTTPTFCNGTYVRIDGSWRYSWGETVPGAADLTLGDLISIDGEVQCAATARRFRDLTDGEERWLAGDASAADQVLLRRRPGYRPHTGDLIIGLMAPELHPLAMLTVGEIAEATGVSKATIDSYRYRGYLPEPQTVRGRTPLWTRPVIRHWLGSRPGSGWRSDLYDGLRSRNDNEHVTVPRDDSKVTVPT
ncbi:MAG: helix-turn-helix transcriptional regulator [Nitriliruptoraceae bacterium]